MFFPGVYKDYIEMKGQTGQRFLTFTGKLWEIG
jgi:hypothetical protein